MNWLYWLDKKYDEEKSEKSYLDIWVNILK